MSKPIKLVRIHLADFGIHEELTVNFAETLTVVKGPNGSGKTTLLQGIWFALFGSSAVDGKATDLPRTGCKTCTSMLFLMIGESNYKITRTPKDATVIDDNDRLIASGHTAVNAWVEEQLGVEQKQALQLMYSEQTETAAMMSLGATALNKMIEKIAEADFITRVEGKASRFGLDSQSQLTAIDQPKDIGELSVRLAEASERLAGASAAATVAAEQEKATSEAVAAHKPILRAAQLTVEQMKKSRETKAAAEAVVISTKSLAEQTLKDLSEIVGSDEDMAALRAERDALSPSIKEAREVLAQMEERDNSIYSLETWFRRIGNSQLAYYKEIKPQHENSVVQLSDSMVTLGKAEIESKVARRELSEAAEAVRAASCPTCKRAFAPASLAEAKTRMDQLRIVDVAATERYLALEKAHAVILGRHKAIKEKLPSESILSDHENKTKKLAALKMLVLPSASEEELEVKTDRLSELASQIGVLREALDRKNTLGARYSVLLAKLEKAQESLKKAEGELADLTEPDMPALLMESERVYAAANVALDKSNRALAQRKEAQLTVTAFESEISRSKALITRRALLERRSANFAELTKFLRSNRSIFMSELWEQLMLLTSEFVSNVTSGRVAKIERDDDGGFYYWEGDARRPFVKLAGGMKAIAGVGLRIALASLLPAGVSLVALDEPSSELADDLAAALAGALRATGRQIILVTHRQGEEYASDEVVELAV